MALFKRLLFTLLLLSAVGGNIQSASAADESAVILSIDVEGNRFVEKQAVVARMGSRVGQRLQRKQLSSDVRQLYKSGFFSNIRFTGTRTPQGIKLVCHVDEYPLIAKLSLEGNDEHTSKDLLLKMKLKPGAFFNPKNQQSDRNTLRKGYLKDGFYQNDVQFISTPAKEGRVDVVVKIYEGEITRINRIRFIGNHTYSNSQLRDAIASRQTDLVSTVMKKDVFNKKRFGADVQMLQQYYLNLGYLDMKSDSEQLTMAADKATFTLTFSIHEGIQYSVDQIDVQGDVIPDKATLLELVKLESGEIYTLQQMSDSIKALTARIGDEGYAFASVTPLLKRNVDAHTVSIVFDIDKGDKVYVERIEITGNEKTDDAVLRRMIRQSEGSRYQGTQLKDSKEALGRAIMVEDVRVSLARADAAGQVNMKVNVKEKKTGSISGGIGYSQREKVILTAKIAENNLFGKGYQVSANGQIGKVTQNFTGSFTDPYFMGTDISASFNVSKVKTDPLTTITYQTDSSSAGFGFGIPITLNLSYNINYNYSKTTLTNVPVTSSLLIQAQAGRTTIGELSQSMVWDSRNRNMTPTSGHRDSLSFAVAGPGGKSRFWSASAGSSLYIPFGKTDDFVLNPSVEYTMIRPLQGQEVPLWRRFSLGGIGSLRGFDSSGVSLRDTVTGEAIGGDSQFRAGVNLFFPLPI
ncbi:MAG: outer membrane protein assembly factor BamA [Mariprofundus sp.]